MKTDRLLRLQQMLESAPSDPFLLFAVAKEYEKTGQLQQALDHYNAVENADPQYVGLYYHKGKLQEHQQQKTAAIATYRKGIEVAMAAGDRHAAAELQGALTEAED